MFNRRKFLLAALSSVTVPTISTNLLEHGQTDAAHAFEVMSGLSRHQNKQNWSEGFVNLSILENAHTKPIYALAMSPDGRLLASGGADRKIKIWNLETRSPIPTEYSASNEVETLEFSPNGRLLASGSMDGNIWVWEVGSSSNTPLFSLRSHTPDDDGLAFTAAAFSPDSNVLATSGGDKVIRLWDTYSGSMIDELLEEQYIFSLQFSLSGHKLASAGAHKVNIWDWESGRKLKALASSEGPIYAAAFSPTNEEILAFSPKVFNVDERNSEESQYSIRIWDLENDEIQDPLIGHEKDILALVFSPNGQTIASASSDGTFKLWDINTSGLIRSFDFHTGRVWSITFNSNGNSFATSGADHSIKIWQASDQ